MATPTWNQIAAPNFSAGNDLIAQAMDQLTKATTGFKSIADQYKDTIQKRNLGLIQEYVNSAKSPEELQSEAFKTGLDNRIKAMGGEYDPLVVNQYIDTRGDTLTRRAVDNLNLESGRFDLGQKRLRAPTELDLLKTQALAAKENYDFAIQNNPLVLKTNTVAADVAERTKETQVAQALANLNKTRKETEDIDINNKQEWARINKPDNTPGGANDPNTTLDKYLELLRDNRKQVNKDAKEKYKWSDPAAWEKDEKHGQWSGTPSKPMRAIVEIASQNKRFQNFKGYKQAAVLDYATNKMMSQNLLSSHDWTVNDKDRERYKAYIEEGIQVYSQEEDLAIAEEAAIFQEGVNALQRKHGLALKDATSVLLASYTPPEEKEVKANPTYDERQKALAEGLQNKPMAEVVERGKNNLNINLKPVPAVGVSRSEFALTKEEANRLSSLAEYSELLGRLNLVNPTPENKAKADKALTAYHVASAELGKLDALTADRYIADIKGYLKDKSLNPLKRKALEEKLKVFESNLKNTQGIKAD